jgi:hypothetical protein
MEVHRSNAKYQECVSIVSIERERSVEFNDTVGLLKLFSVGGR